MDSTHLQRRLFVIVTILKLNFQASFSKRNFSYVVDFATCFSIKFFNKPNCLTKGYFIRDFMLLCFFMSFIFS